MKGFGCLVIIMTTFHLQCICNKPHNTGSVNGALCFFSQASLQLVIFIQQNIHINKKQLHFNKSIHVLFERHYFHVTSSLLYVHTEIISRCKSAWNVASVLLIKWWVSWVFCGCTAHWILLILLLQCNFSHMWGRFTFWLYEKRTCVCELHHLINLSLSLSQKAVQIALECSYHNSLLKSYSYTS